MRLIGLLDSPYVRRVAITLQHLALPFVHEPLSVFRHVDAFAAINPVVKAPTLVCDDGTVLLDSSLIVDHAETLARPRTLWPADPGERAQALRITGLALAALEKYVQVVYEHELRPPEKAHAPWLARIERQLRAACAGLEADVARRPAALTDPAATQAGLTAAVAWHFMTAMPHVALDPAGHPALAALSTRAEALPAFRAAPHGEAAMRAAAVAPTR